MNWPNWMQDNVLQWLTGISMGVIGIVVSVILAFWPTNVINSKSLATELAKYLPNQQRPEKEIDAEIMQLKATIERLQKDTANEFKKAALKELEAGNTSKATDFMEKSALSREKQAAHDWVDVGNIA